MNNRRLPVILLLLVFTGACAAAIGSGRIPWRVANDQIVYHEAAIREFARQWPHFDLQDYLSVTTPGYHLLLAALVRAGAGATSVLQGASALIGAALVGVVAFFAGRPPREGSAPNAPAIEPWAWSGALLAAPLAASMYVFQSAAWILPDNLAWLLVAVILAMCLRSAPTPGRMVLTGVLLAALVFVRQNHLWVAGVIWAWAWFHGVPMSPEAQKQRLLALMGQAVQELKASREGSMPPQPLETGDDGRLARMVLAAVVTAPAFAIIAWFAWQWGGLTPARYRGFHQGMNPATPAFVLAVMGGAGVFFGPLFARPLLNLVRLHWPVLLAGAMIAGVAASFTPTTFSQEAGRWTGLWNLTKSAPVIGHASLVIVVLAVIGGVVLVTLMLALPRRAAGVLVISLLGFTAAQSMNAQCWQRYIEPLVLILLALAGGMVLPHHAPRRVAWLGVVLLAAAFAAMDVQAMRGAPKIENAVAPGVEPMGGPYVPRHLRAPTR